MDKNYDYAKVEERIRKFWADSRIFDFDPGSAKKVYAIDTPPPTVSGDIHLGHVFSYSQPEFVARYKRMRGFSVFYPFGLDNNGLPTELLIEKKFGTTSEKEGREKFVELVKKEIVPYNEKYIELFKRLGISADWNLLYQTISDDVQKASQKSFLELIKIGRAYRKEAPIIYCPREKTAISQMELEDKKFEGTIYTVKFADDITIATTRPELLPACVAIFVNPDDERCKALLGKKIKIPIFDTEVDVLSDYRVSQEFGTGIVMCCTFGDQTDIEWYKAYNLQLRIIINKDGRLEHPYYGAMSISDGRAKVVDDLRRRGLILKEEKISQVANVHDRCGTKVEFIVKPQWYIKYLDLKDEFIKMGQQITWYPQYMRVRFENWINGIKWDWCISRQRYFGVLFPVWYCGVCGEPAFANENELPVNPFVQKPSANCKCGSSDFLPETDVMDTWATSSLTPLINAHWATDGKYMDKILPMDLRPQAHDIIAFWAFTTVVKSYFHTGKIPWKSIMISGHGLNADGSPMHKSTTSAGPVEYIDKYGADPIRYWASSSVLGLDTLFEEKALVTGKRLVNKMWNLARFIEQAAQVSSATGAQSQSIFDNWILSRLQTVITDATAKFEEFDYFSARRIAEEGFWEFANDYLEFVKSRVYDGDEVAKQTINTIFLSYLKLLAPFVPFITEELYQSSFAGKEGLGTAKSIHISEWPEQIAFDSSLARPGELGARILVEARKMRHDKGMPLNSDLSEMILFTKSQSLLEPAALQEVRKAAKVEKISFSDTKTDGNEVKSIGSDA